jgi:hypothetical protein
VELVEREFRAISISVEPNVGQRPAAAYQLNSAFLARGYPYTIALLNGHAITSRLEERPRRNVADIESFFGTFPYTTNSHRYRRQSDRNWRSGNTCPVSTFAVAGYLPLPVAAFFALGVVTLKNSAARLPWRFSRGEDGRLAA